MCSKAVAGVKGHTCPCVVADGAAHTGESKFCAEQHGGEEFDHIMNNLSREHLWVRLEFFSNIIRKQHNNLGVWVTEWPDFSPMSLIFLLLLSSSPPDHCAHCALACLFCEFLSLCSLALDCVGCGSCLEACCSGNGGESLAESCCGEAGGGNCPCGLGCGMLQDCCSSSDCLEICLECCSICFPAWIHKDFCNVHSYVLPFRYGFVCVALYESSNYKAW